MSIFIENFLKKEQIETNLYSVLNITLNDLRKITGKKENGELETLGLYNEKYYLNPYAFSVIISYFSVLDLLGSIFKLSTNTTFFQNNIKNALTQFGGNLTNEEINILIALRNSLTHNLSLISYSIGKQTKSACYHFTLINKSGNNLLINNGKWDGNIDTKCKTNSVDIYLDNFFNLCEMTYSTIVEKFDNKEIDLRISEKEIKARFTIRH